MSAIIKGGLSLVAVSGGCVGTYFGIHHFNNKKVRETFKDKLTSRLLSADGDNNRKEWEERISFLKDAKVKSDSLSSELKEIKDTPSKTWASLRDLCSKWVKETYEESGNKINEMIDYCTFRNKDKLGTGIITSNTVDSKWQAANEVLNGKNEGLSKAMQEVKRKLSAAGTNDNSALKTWCEKIYETPWESDEDSNFMDAKVYCKEKNVDG